MERETSLPLRRPAAAWSTPIRCFLSIAVLAGHALFSAASVAEDVTEIMTDRCSGDVSFPLTYDGLPGGPTVITRGKGSQSPWTQRTFTQKLDKDGHVRWWCHSTTGNWADAGTWFCSEVGIALECPGDDWEGCQNVPKFDCRSSDVNGWTAERSRCNDRSSTFKARLGPDRLLQIACVHEPTGQAGFKLVVAAMASVSAADVRYAGIWVKGTGAWLAQHGMPAEQFQKAFDEQASKGLRLQMVDGYQVDGADRYAAIWESPPRSPAPRVARHGMTAEEYQQAFDKYSAAAGYRLIWVNGYTLNGQDRYAAIWEKSAGPAWVAHHGLTAPAFQKQFDQLVKEGYRLKLISGYAVVTEARYAAVWEKAPSPPWIARIAMSEADYQKEFNEHSAAGYRLAHLSGYRVGEQILFAAIWDKAASAAWVAHHNMTPDQYQQQFKTLSAQGYRLVQVGGY